jgi:hypothetical protein
VSHWRQGERSPPPHRSQPAPPSHPPLTRPPLSLSLSLSLSLFRPHPYHSLNKCGVISPRYDVGHGDIEDWVERLLPSRLFGTIVLTTSAGICSHEEARAKKLGGKVLGFFY